VKEEMEADEIVNQKVNFSLCNDSSLEVQRVQGTDQTEDFQDSEGQDFTESSVKVIYLVYIHILVSEEGQ
jgi:hypothetical protein